MGSRRCLLVLLLALAAPRGAGARREFVGRLGSGPGRLDPRALVERLLAHRSSRA